MHCVGASGSLAAVWWGGRYLGAVRPTETFHINLIHHGGSCWIGLVFPYLCARAPLNRPRGRRSTVHVLVLVGGARLNCLALGPISASWAWCLYSIFFFCSSRSCPLMGPRPPGVGVAAPCTDLVLASVARTNKTSPRPLFFDVGWWTQFFLSPPWVWWIRFLSSFCPFFCISGAASFLFLCFSASCFGLNPRPLCFPGFRAGLVDLGQNSGIRPLNYDCPLDKVMPLLEVRIQCSVWAHDFDT